MCESYGVAPGPHLDGGERYRPAAARKKTPGQQSLPLSRALESSGREGGWATPRHKEQ